MKLTVFSGKIDGIINVKLNKLLGEYLTCANVIGNRVRILGFDAGDSSKGRSIKDIVLDFRAKGTVIDLQENVDIVPALLIVSAFACSETQLILDREVIKENAEFLSLAIKNLNDLGGEAVLEEDKIVVKGKSLLLGGGEIDANNDLRLALAFLLAGTVAEKKIKIDNVGVINLCFPTLINELKALGLNIVEE